MIQDAALLPHLNVQGNLAYGHRRIAPNLRRVALDQVVDWLGIGHMMQRRPSTLSGGERQRVAIARALATSPKLLLMDEPLAALDAQRKADLLPYLDRLHCELAIPIVYVTHAPLEEVARLAHHLVLDAVVAQRDTAWQLARLDVLGLADPKAFSLWARDPGLALGSPVRVRLLARDVSLARCPQTETSIGNQLQGTAETIADDEHAALALLRVRVNGVPVVARLTRRSAHRLELAAGMLVWVQVTTVALME